MMVIFCQCENVQLFPLLHFPLYVCALPEQFLCIIARKPFVFCLAPKSKFSVCISSPGHDRTYVMGSFLRQMHTLSLWVLLLPPLPSLFSQNVQTVCPELLRKFLLYFLLRNAPKDLPITATATAAATALKRLVCLPSVFIFSFFLSKQGKIYALLGVFFRRFMFLFWVVF